MPIPFHILSILVKKPYGFPIFKSIYPMGNIAVFRKSHSLTSVPIGNYLFPKEFSGQIIHEPYTIAIQQHKLLLRFFASFMAQSSIW